MLFNLTLIASLGYKKYYDSHLLMLGDIKQSAQEYQPVREAAL